MRITNSFLHKPNIFDRWGEYGKVADLSKCPRMLQNLTRAASKLLK